MAVLRSAVRETRAESDCENINTQNLITNSLIREVINIKNSFNFIKEINKKNILYRRIIKFLIKIEELISQAQTYY